MTTWDKDALVAHCIARLDEADRRARIAWCKEVGEPDVAVADDGETLDIFWGGRPLVTVPRAVLADPDAPVHIELIGAAPDDPSSLTDGS